MMLCDMNSYFAGGAQDSDLEQEGISSGKSRTGATVIGMIDTFWWNGTLSSHAPSSAMHMRPLLSDSECCVMCCVTCT